MQRPESKIPSASIAVTASRIFTYPTRLADCWMPEMQEINLPGYRITRPEIAIASQKGSTHLAKNGYLNSVYRKFLSPIQRQDGHIFDARYDTDGNIAHVLENIVPPALLAQALYSNVTVILHARASVMAKTAFELLRIPIFCTEADVHGNLIVLKQEGRDRFIGDGVHSFLFDDVVFDGYKSRTPERIFISRRKTRYLLNEVELEQLLRKFGFDKVYFEDIPLNEQWSLARNARVIVAVHGAALSSLVFNRSAVKIIELFHPGYVVKLYRNLSSAIGATWCGVAGQLPPDVIKHLDYEQKARHFALHPLRIDCTSLMMALKYVGVE